MSKQVLINQMRCFAKKSGPEGSTLRGRFLEKGK